MVKNRFGRKGATEEVPSAEETAITEEVAVTEEVLETAPPARVETSPPYVIDLIGAFT